MEMEVGLGGLRWRVVSACPQKMLIESADGWISFRRLLYGSHGQVRLAMGAGHGGDLVRGSACGCADPAKPP